MPEAPELELTKNSSLSNLKTLKLNGLLDDLVLDCNFKFVTFCK